jgi:hypothetical protein
MSDVIVVGYDEKGNPIWKNSRELEEERFKKIEDKQDEHENRIKKIEQKSSTI